MSSVVWRRVW